MSGMVLRRVQNLSGDWRLEIGHYTPDGAWEVLDDRPDGDLSFEAAVNLLSRLHGGIDRHDLFAAAVLPGLLARGERTEYIWPTKTERERRELADRAYELASEVEYVLSGGK